MASTSETTLDDLIPSPNSKDVVPLPPRDDHLFYPSLEDEEPLAGRGTPPADSQPRQVLKDRLYIGNLHPSVDEYTLLQVFSKFGKVTKLDYLFHKTGLLKGKPRGYAFIEYGDKDEALKALTMAHEKPLRGRKLVVTFAQQAPLDQYPSTGAFKTRRTMMDTGRPTTLSMIKTGVHGRHHEGTQDKIAMMEAKLRQMERSNPKPKAPSPEQMDLGEPSSSTTPSASAPGSTSTTSASTPTQTLPAHPSLPSKPVLDNNTSTSKSTSISTSTSTSTSTPASSLPYHPSLPAKPPPVIPALQAAALPHRPAHHHQSSSSGMPMFGVQKKALPKDPQALAAPLIKSLSATTTTGTRPAKPNKLTGVKIKAKEKPKDTSSQS